MKVIYVTIQEFLEHGGKLEKGRALYAHEMTGLYKDYSRFRHIGSYEEYNSNIQAHIIKAGWGTFPTSEITTLVELEVIPVWK